MECFLGDLNQLSYVSHQQSNAEKIHMHLFFSLSLTMYFSYVTTVKKKQIPIAILFMWYTMEKCDRLFKKEQA
jgi:hypothetical protein